ncbi:MAG: GDP-L-fucose synthase [Candidatus Margulisiibacteriota bacterium]
MKKGSKIYVAGHAGLLGSAVVRKLNKDGFDNIRVVAHSELDLTDSKQVKDFFAKETPEYVFLAAGITGGILANSTYPADFFHKNIAIQDNVFEAAKKYGVKNLVFYGSSCMYPKICPSQIKEEMLLTGHVEETSEAYAAAKIAGIYACRAYNRQAKSNIFIALVPNSLYGINDNYDPKNSHVISSFITKFHKAKTENAKSVELWGTGTPRREFLFCDDAAEASVFAVMNADKLENKHYNVGSGSDNTIKELASMIAGEIGYEGEIIWDTSRPDGSPRKLLDSSRFRDLGWAPKTMLKEGIRSAYNAFKGAQA